VAGYDGSVSWSGPEVEGEEQMIDGVGLGIVEETVEVDVEGRVPFSLGSGKENGQRGK
jgi:hypothetical protein